MMDRVSSFQRTAAVLFVALLASYAYFYQSGGWNQNARFALVRAILERQTLQIDAYHEYTGDKAMSQGHYYSDKAPGASLLALAPVSVARGISRLFHVDPRSRRGIAWTSYAATVATSGLFTILATFVVLHISRQGGASRGAALFGATAYGIASPAWCYATLFMGQAISAGCLMLAFAAAIALDERARTEPLVGRLGAAVKRDAWVIGVATGLSVLTEFPAAIPSFFIVTMGLLAYWNRGWRSLVPIALRILAGGLISGVVLLAHNAAAFGAPLHLGYAVADSPLGRLNTGFFGIESPAWWKLREILVGSYRGLLPIFPLAAVAPIGLAMIARTSQRRRAAVVAAAIVVYYLMFNASYYYWEGGWAYGPRQIMSALPFMALGLAPLWDGFGRWGRVALTGGWLWGAALTLIAVSTTPQPPADLHAPVLQLLWPAFKTGDLSVNNQSFVTYRAQPDLLLGHPELHTAWNLGELAGLHGLPSLLPLAGVWAVSAVLLLRERPRPPRDCQRARQR